MGIVAIPFLWAFVEPLLTLVVVLPWKTLGKHLLGMAALGMVAKVLEVMLATGVLRVIVMNLLRMVVNGLLRVAALCQMIVACECQSLGLEHQGSTTAAPSRLLVVVMEVVILMANLLEILMPWLSTITGKR